MLKKIVVIGMLFLVPLVIFAIPNRTQNIETQFDVNDVIKQVMHNPLGNDNNKSGLSDEFLVDTNPVQVPFDATQRHPEVAFDGNNYLVVWEDNRNVTSNSDIYGCRVRADGTVLDPSGIAISTASENQFNPSIAFDGTNYLVVWNDYRSGANYDIYGSRVSSAGLVLDPSGIAISTAPDNQLNPSVAFGNTDYLVVWCDRHDDIYGSRVSTSGTVLDPSGIAISTATSTKEVPSVAFDGTNYLVVWMDARNYSTTGTDIYGCRVSTSGTVLDLSGIVISNATNNQYGPKVAFGITSYLVVWEDLRDTATTGRNIYGSRVSTGGSVLNPSGIAISTASSDQIFPSIAFDGTNYFVIWQFNVNIYGSRVSTNGSVLDLIAISTNPYYQEVPSVTFGGTCYLVVWHDWRTFATSSHDIYGCRVNTAGTVLEPNGILISYYINAQNNPAVAYDGTNYLVVWQDNRNYNLDIYGCRVNASGDILDPTLIVISTAVNDQARPAIAFDGTNYLVVWNDYRSSSNWDIYGSRVNPAGTVLDPSGIAISTAANNQYVPAVVFGGTNYLVVWEDTRNGNWDIYGSRVSTGGSVLDASGIAISNALNTEENPSIAFDGTNYFVVWHDDRNGPNWDIYGSLVNQYGYIINPSGIAISTATGGQVYPCVVWGRTTYLVAWTDSRSVSNYDIYGSRVSPAGVVIDPSGLAISTATGNQMDVSLAFDSINYLAVWSDNRGGSDYDVYGAKLSRAGAVINTMEISTSSNNQLYPKLAYGNDQIFIAYQGYTGTENSQIYNTDRTWGRIYTTTNELTINTNGNGTVIKEPDLPNYNYGTWVRLTASPGKSGWHFMSWSDSLTGNNNPDSVLMNSNKVVTATFAIDTFTITATATSGGAISPSGEITMIYGDDTTFAITPNTNYHIDSVVVDNENVGTDSVYTFTNVITDHTITAYFSIDYYSLTMNIIGNGTVIKIPDSTYYPYGTEVWMNAVPDTGYAFVGWSGSINHMSTPTVIMMKAGSIMKCNIYARWLVSERIFANRC